MADRPGTPESEAQWRAAGDRIQTLLDSCAAGGAAAYERAQQLVREVVGLYGAGLERILQLAGNPGPDNLAERLATDDLVASLLLVHGLHPHDVHRRVSDALDRVRPYLGSHGGDVDLLEITDTGALRLAFKGSCKSCPSSAVTLELAVEDAVRAAAPEITSIEVVSAEPSSVIPAESLMAHVKSNGHSWHRLPEVAELAPGEVAGFMVAGTTVLACRVGDQTLAYRDHCPICRDSLAGAKLRGEMLRCPRCQTDFDVVHAGAGPDAAHLEPLPLLPRDGVLSVALQSEATGVPA
ncbi:NifU family protein [Mycobacterium sp.]|jgi:Fe-S cluster biogenesis protein NfuA/nitrite reductase/ring-hydroxylating ferredoxin subunit|uniref:NifU family protein n=1 Tax=Mycobacterium sp. TaxID=1785 RepID=UPI002B5845FA|nr:NifU family protein [Mycobacterium sp.]HTQ22444.1 NifU family protein [Mycobacterium sp.]